MRFSIRTASGDAPHSERVEKVETPRPDERTQEEFDAWAGIPSLKMMARYTPERAEAARESTLRFWRDYGTNHRIEDGVYKRDLPALVEYFVDLETLDDLRALRAEVGNPVRLEDDELLIVDEDYY